MRSLLTVTSLALLAAIALPCANAQAQSCCGTPTVAYSPVAAVAPAPVVAVQTQERSRLAKILDPLQIFSRDRVTTTVNYGAAPYTAGYTPYTAAYQPYTAGYSPYTVGYAPSPYTAAYTPQVAYRPTYPATYGAVALPQTVSRPVALSPVVSAPACDACSTGCDACSACGGVEQAYYGAPSTGCSSCNAGASYSAPVESYNGDYGNFQEPRPALDRGDNVAPERSLLEKPEVDEDFGTDPIEGDPAAASDYWRAPPLFPPSNRVTQRSHPAPARTAVYRRPAETRQTAFRPSATRGTARPQGKVNRLSGEGWESAAN